MWEEYFPNAQLHFIDNNPNLIQHSYKLSSRSKLHIMNQNDKAKLIELANQVGEFDIIIDDGSHYMDDQQCSFITLFPFVKSGGMYIIEDYILHIGKCLEEKVHLVIQNHQKILPLNF